MSENLEKTYNPKAIEAKLYEKWCDNKYFHAEVDRSKKPFTTVMPPPNITGKLHMGHEGVVSSSVVMLTTMCSAFTLTGWLFIMKCFGLV